MSSWPSILPRPLLGGYSLNPADQTLRTDMESGAARVRRRSRARLDLVDVAWKFTDAQMAVFREWFDNSNTAEASGTAQAGGSIHSGTAQAGAASTITLAAAASATNDYYKHATLTLTGGTGSGQVREITAYAGATKVATVDAAWVTVPDATSTYDITPGTSGIVLAAGASATAEYYKRCTLHLVGGAGLGQTRTITAYNGYIKLAIVDSAWATPPDATSIYEISGGADGGAAWFTTSLTTGDGGIVGNTARFNGPWKSALLPGLNHHVTARIEVR